MKHHRLSLVAPLLLASALSSRAAHATYEVGLGAAYDVRAPVGGLKDFTPNVSFSGLQAKWDFFPLDKLSVGVEGQYQLFQRGVETTSTPIANGTITAPTYRYTSIWSFLPTVRYYLTKGTFRPYGELGAGVSNATGGILASDQALRSNGVSFILQPSVGVLIRLWSDLTPRPEEEAELNESLSPGIAPPRKPIESMFGVTASFTYAYTTTDVVGESNINYAGFQVGIYAKP